MAKIKQSPKLPPEQRRRQLLTAARTLFMRKGYRGTTTAEIALTAGLTKGALYHHFGAKEEILFELVQVMQQELIEAVSSVPPQKGRPADLLRVLLESKPEAGTADFAGYLDFWVQAVKIPRIRRYLRDSMEEYDDLFASRIDRAYARTRQDRHDLAVMIIAMRDGLTVRKMLGNTEVDFPRQLKLLTSLMADKMNKAKKSKKR